MILNIPLYIQYDKLYHVRPLFFTSPYRSHEKLERAINFLTQDLRHQLREIGRGYHQEELARYSFSPKMQYHRLNVTIELRKRIARCRYFFVVLRKMGRKLAFTPSLPDLWIELDRGEDLQERANEVLTAHFRKWEREEENGFIQPEQFALEGTAWITPIELDVYPRATPEEQKVDPHAFLGSQERMDGERELFRVGHCLDQLYPDDLDRVVHREKEVNELTRLLRYRDRRPVLILGPPLVGKTALIHEYVYRIVSRRKRKHRVRNYLWLLSPQRMISGMSYVGQWENRLLAILREAERKQHILYFDDFLGLYFAGKHSQSDLSMAHVLKPYVEQRKVRIVVEMTPELLRVFREQDRGFADLFHILPVSEPSAEENLRILLSVERQLEGRLRCRFALDVLPMALDLQRRYMRHLSFPGKAAVFLRRLAVKHRKSDIPREAVLEEFHTQSGLSLTFLDDRQKLERSEVVEALESKVIGQREALEAAADVISVAKARLNDPDRPLASFLFLGPTGVGKTECSKAIAAYLFGDVEKLIRFDMNEHSEPGAAARLVGTFYNPEGLLTAAVRRQPFSVVLLDEIEKADGEVFDLLLQVLGEGRLTDPLGRTADFSNTIVIMTSNLGVREASAQIGFRSDEKGNRHIYEQAAERFFRPEFFNRLDRIVPFARLTQEQIKQIARLLMDDLLQREGLLRRKCILRVDDSAMDQVAENGFDPTLGARALKRSLERQITQPVAEQLAEGLPQTVTVVSISTGDKTLQVEVDALEPVPSVQQGPLQYDCSNPDRVLEKTRAALRKMEAQIAPFRPEGAITAESLEGEHVQYYTAQEQIQQVWHFIQEIEEYLDASRHSRHSFPTFPVTALNRACKLLNRARWESDWSQSPWRDLSQADDIHLYLDDLANQTVPSRSELEEAILELLRRLAHARLLTDSCGRDEPEQVMVYIRPMTGSTSQLAWFAPLQEQVFTERLNLHKVSSTSTKPSFDYLYVLRGLAAVPLCQLEQGTHLLCPQHGGLVALQVMALPLPEDQTALELLEEQLGANGDQQGRLPLLPLVRTYNQPGSMIDFRTGQMAPSDSDRSPFLLSSLPLPEEMWD